MNLVRLVEQTDLNEQSESALEIAADKMKEVYDALISAGFDKDVAVDILVKLIK